MLQPEKADPIRMEINPLPDDIAAFDYRELGTGDANVKTPLARETALAISYNNISHAVMMVSPEDLEDFVIGFSLANDIVHSADEIYDIQIAPSGDSHQANLVVSSRAQWALKKERRQLAGNSSCGLCGIEAIERAMPELNALPPTPVPAHTLFTNLRDRMAAAQKMASASGALHAAVYIDGSGSVTLCREDIGRHNALDKLIGAMTRGQHDTREGFVAVTSRCGLELVLKAVRARIATLACLSAPTSLTVQWARRYGLNLIHIPHHSAPRLYSPAP